MDKVKTHEITQEDALIQIQKQGLRKSQSVDGAYDTSPLSSPDYKPLRGDKRLKGKHSLKKKDSKMGKDRSASKISSNSSTFYTAGEEDADTSSGSIQSIQSMDYNSSLERDNRRTLSLADAEGKCDSSKSSPEMQGGEKGGEKGGGVFRSLRSSVRRKFKGSGSQSEDGGIVSPSSIKSSEGSEESLIHNEQLMNLSLSSSSLEPIKDTEIDCSLWMRL